MVAPICAANRLPGNSNVMYAKPTTVCFEASVTSAVLGVCRYLLRKEKLDQPHLFADLVCHLLSDPRGRGFLPTVYVRAGNHRNSAFWIGHGTSTCVLASSRCQAERCLCTPRHSTLCRRPMVSRGADILVGDQKMVGTFVFDSTFLF